MDGSVRINPYLDGNFAPVRSEDDFELVVAGEIPADLAGTLYRTGPNPQFDPRDAHHHWFAGDGMVHAFHVEGGKVRYRNRYVRTPKWQAENAAGKALFGTFGNPMTTDPDYVGQDSGVANTNIVFHAGKLLALEEAHPPFEMEPGTLASKSYLDFGGKFTAHPKFDPVTGEMVFFSYSSGPMPFSSVISYGVADADGRLTRRQDFEAPYCSMIHDFMVTRGHVLFPVLPLTGCMQRAMGGLPPLAWEPEKPAMVGVMARDADVSTVRWFTTDAAYVFHPMNAWEEDGKIYADVMRYDAAPFFPLADGSPGKNCAAYLTRWVFDLNSDSDVIREEPLDDLAGEFPRFDERFAFAPYRHGWIAGQSRRPGDIRTDSLAHLDLKTGARHTWRLPEGDYVSEPVFTPRSASAEEGDGWITAVVYRGEEDVSEFVVLEAQDVAAGPIASAKMPRRVPFGFHGNWVSA
ncbi:MAG TPA: carotenoid oxygenase family protein [Caulobacteraceae bacterium]|nr:carotenoid oxygenase family protein [Caulobacteraceae bacterium]